MLLTRELFNDYWKSKGYVATKLDYYSYLLGESIRNNFKKSFQ